jgi:hypothetical protein
MQQICLKTRVAEQLYHVCGGTMHGDTTINLRHKTYEQNTIRYSSVIINKGHAMDVSLVSSRASH